MVEQPKYLEMTLSQLKAYVESSESNVFLARDFGDFFHGIFHLFYSDSVSKE